MPTASSAAEPYPRVALVQIVQCLLSRSCTQIDARSHKAMLGTHVIDEGMHARKSHDARPPVLFGRSNDRVLKAGSLQLECRIS